MILHDVDSCPTTNAGDVCSDCEDAICQRCGQYKDSDPSAIPGDDLCGHCRPKTDNEDAEETR